MLNPQQQHGGDLLVHDPPPVFGKPWYWQRSSSTMESTRSLAQVIMEMRDEIKKLEAENRELRGECAQDSSGHGSGGACEEYSAGKEQEGIVENPYGNLRRNASAPILEGQFKESSVMTVRRYSTSSNLSGMVVRDGRADKAKQSNSAWGRLREEMQRENDLFNNSDKREVEEEVINRHSLQEYVQKNRAKVKSVSFLLPVDDIYTNRPVLTKHLEEPKIAGLASDAHDNLNLVSSDETQAPSAERIRCPDSSPLPELLLQGDTHTPAGDRPFTCWPLTLTL